MTLPLLSTRDLYQRNKKKSGYYCVCSPTCINVWHTLDYIIFRKFGKHVIEATSKHLIFPSKLSYIIKGGGQIYSGKHKIWTAEFWLLIMFQPVIFSPLSSILLGCDWQNLNHCLGGGRADNNLSTCIYYGLYSLPPCSILSNCRLDWSTRFGQVTMQMHFFKKKNRNKAK